MKPNPSTTRRVAFLAMALLLGADIFVHVGLRQNAWASGGGGGAGSRAAMVSQLKRLNTRVASLERFLKSGHLVVQQGGFNK